MKNKKCTYCKKKKQLKHFHSDKSKKSGRQSRCKVCVKRDRKKYINRNRKRIYAYNKEWQKRNLDKYRVYNKKAYQKRKLKMK